MDGIRKMLGLETEAGMFPVHHPTFPREAPVEKVSRVKLHSWFGGPDFHLPPGRRIEHARGEPQPPRSPAQHEVSVVTPPITPQLRDVRANGDPAREIEWRSPDGTDLTRRNQTCVHRRVTLRVELQYLAQDVSAAAEI